MGMGQKEIYCHFRRYGQEESITGNETRNVNIQLKLNESPLSSYYTLNDQAPYPIDGLKLKLLNVIQFE